VTESELLTGPERARAQRAAVFANLSAAAVAMVVTGSLMQLFVVDVLQWQPASIALLLAVLPLTQLMRYLALPWLRRVSRRALLVRLGLVRVLIVVLAAFLPVAWLQAGAFVVVVLVFHCALQLGPGVAWQPLLRDITTNSDRTSFFGRMRFWFSVVSLLATGAATLLVGESIDPWTYRFFLIFSALLLMNHVWWVRRMPDPPPPPELEGSRIGGSWRRLWSIARHAQVMRRPLLVQIGLVLVVMPVLPVYLRQVLELSAQFVAALLLTHVIGALAGYRLWGLLGDAVGYRPLLLGLALLTAATMPLWLLLPPATVVAWPNAAALAGMGAVLLWSLLQGAMMEAGIGLATTAMVHHAVDRDEALEAMSTFGLAISFATAMWAALSGWFLQSVVLPAEQAVWLHGLVYVDPMKWWLAVGVPLVLLVVVVAAWRLPNARSDADLADFFAGIAHNPWRSLREGRHLFADAERERLRLARLLGQGDNPLNTAPLVRLFDDASFDVRVEAIRSAARQNPDRVAPQLEALLVEGDEPVWEHAVWSLGELAWRPAVPRLLDLLSPTMPVTVRVVAARALGKIGDQAAVPALSGLLHEPTSAGVHASAGRALLRLHATECAAELLTLLRDHEDRHERYELMAVLCEWLQLPSSWLLRAPSHLRFYDHVERHLTFRSPRWLAARQEVVDAFAAHDVAKLQAFVAERAGRVPAASVTAALFVAVAEAERWGPVLALATVWLLYAPAAGQESVADRDGPAA
jgi:Na+/melibiose symporter-like transporter